MRKILFTLLSSIFWFGIIQSTVENKPVRAGLDYKYYSENEHYILNLYLQLDDTSLNYNAFKTALQGYYLLEETNTLHNKNVLTIIDYSKSANTKRLYVIDLYDQKILFKTFVAHGKDSGKEYPTIFSNECQSHKSSLGFFITDQTYYGRHGYSLRLTGLEKGFNSNAWKRAIVIHGARYVSSDYILHNGRLGRSFGCPALPVSVNKRIIDIIKNGSCLFCYYPEKKYFNSSPVLQRTNNLEVSEHLKN